MADQVSTSMPSSPVNQTPATRNTPYPAATSSIPDDEAVATQDHNEQGAETTSQADDERPPIMKLPTELRLKIYKRFYDSIFQDIHDQISAAARNNSLDDQAASKAALDQDRKTLLKLLHISVSIRAESAEEGAKLLRELEDDLVVQCKMAGWQVHQELKPRLTRVRRVSAFLGRVQKNIREAERKKEIKLRLGSG